MPNSIRHVAIPILVLLPLLAGVVPVDRAVAQEATATIVDDFESDLWTFGFHSPEYNAKVAAYDTQDAHGGSRCIRTWMGAGPGYYNDAWATRTFPLATGQTPEALSVWFCRETRLDDWLEYAALVTVRALDASGAALDEQTYDVMAFCGRPASTFQWSNQPGWIYQEQRPGIYETGAPDYGRAPDGDIDPPAEWWYRLRVQPVDDLAVDWSQVASLEIRLTLKTMWFSTCSGGMRWDDLELTLAGGADDAESDTWAFDHANAAFPGTWIAGYDDADSHSPDRSLLTRFQDVGPNNDVDTIFAERAFTHVPGLIPGEMGVWYCMQEIEGGSYLQVAALATVTALGLDGQPLDERIHCLAVSDNTNGSWEGFANWAYQEGRPAVYEPGAPDYGRNPDGSILPPSGWWYRFAVDPTEDLDVNWAHVGEVRLRLAVYGAWAAGNAAGVRWDDALFAETNPFVDHFEEPLWAFGHAGSASPVYWTAGYCDQDAHSLDQSIRLTMADAQMPPGSDTIHAERIFPLPEGHVPGEMGVWYSTCQVDCAMGFLEGAARVTLAALDEAGVSLDEHDVCLLCRGGTSWTANPAWAYQDTSPPEREENAPDYARDGNGWIVPPVGWWYRFACSPVEVLDVDWAEVRSLKVRLSLGGSSLFANALGFRWDDLALFDNHLTTVEDVIAPHMPAVLGAHPNPFNPVTTFSFRLEAPGAATLDVHALDGRLVRRLLSGRLQKGEHRVVWDGRDDAGRRAASGAYLARLVAGGRAAAGKVTLIK